MDNLTTINEMKEIVKNFCEERDWDQFHNAKDLAIGISTEANELLQIFRFKSVAELEQIMESNRKTEIEEELADVFYFVIRFAQMNGIDLSEAVTQKIEKNAKKYPVDKAKGCNKKYNEYK
ncbi:MAG: nucleotide pyrophosphohydrolase [Bacilli bacterium]|nr:nucleotide pyrophosphohydrolase [Bacilli bacterium]